MQYIVSVTRSTPCMGFRRKLEILSNNRTNERNYSYLAGRIVSQVLINK